MDLALSWTPRDQNEEADDLTNSRFGRFDPALRINLEVSAIDWKVLPTMLKVAEELYADVQAMRQDGKSRMAEHGQAARLAKRKPLRERDPW